MSLSLRTILLPLLLLCSMNAAAEAMPKIAILHSLGALLQTEKVQAELKGLQNEFSSEEAEIKKVAQGVERLRERIKKDGAVMSDAEKLKLAKELEEGLTDYKYLGGKFQKQVNERQQQILANHRQSLEKAVKEVIEEGGYELLLEAAPGGSVLYVAPQYDITAEVTKKLNKIL